jgi:hypothetical protein
MDIVSLIQLYFLMSLVFLFLDEFFIVGMAKLKVVPFETLIDKVIKVSLFFGFVN